MARIPKQLSWPGVHNSSAAIPPQPRSFRWAIWKSSVTLLALALLTLFGFTNLPAQEPNPEIDPATATKTDATFVFSADVHMSFNGYDDHQGIENSGAAIDFLLVKNETATSFLSPLSHMDGCIGKGFESVKDLC